MKRCLLIWTAAGILAFSLLGLALPASEPHIPSAVRSYKAGQALEKDQRLDDAVAAFRKALEIDPALGEAYEHLGRIYERAGNFEEATRAFVQLTQLEPENLRALLALGEIYTQRDYLADALALYYRAVRVDAKSAPARLGLAHALDKNKEYAKAAAGRRSRFAVELTPARKWNLFLVPNQHLDIGYTDYDSKVAELHARSVDEAMEMVERHPEFRFTFDGSWIVDEFLKGRSAEDQKKFPQFVQEKKLFVPAVYASNFTGFSGLESLIRSLYRSRQFAAEAGGDYDVALINDVPNASWSYASVLAAAGIKHFVVASGAYRAPFLPALPGAGGTGEPGQSFFSAPQDSRRLELRCGRGQSSPARCFRARTQFRYQTLRNRDRPPGRRSGLRRTRRTLEGRERGTTTPGAS